MAKISINIYKEKVNLSSLKDGIQKTFDLDYLRNFPAMYQIIPPTNITIAMPAHIPNLNMSPTSSHPVINGVIKISNKNR